MMAMNTDQSETHPQQLINITSSPYLFKKKTGVLMLTCDVIQYQKQLSIQNISK